MRTVGIWVSGLLASAIPFIFVGAVIVFSASVFDAQGEQTPPAPSRASFQEEAASPEQALAVATANAPDDAQRQPAKQARGDADARRYHYRHAPPRRSGFHSRVRYSPFEFGFERLRAAFANQWSRARVQ
jgi:hypothetical protein